TATAFISFTRVPASRRQPLQVLRREGQENRLIYVILARLLSFLTRIILCIDVIDAPWTGAVELDNRLFVGEEIVLQTGGQRKDAARWKYLILVVIGRRSHAQARCPGEHGDNFRLGMGVRSYVVALRHFQTKSKQGFLARVAVKHRRLRTGWQGGRC